MKKKDSKDRIGRRSVLGATPAVLSAGALGYVTDTNYTQESEII